MPRTLRQRDFRTPITRSRGGGGAVDKPVDNAVGKTGDMTRATAHLTASTRLTSWAHRFGAAV